MESLKAPVTNSESIESIKVLVADDDHPTRILLKAAISQWGYSVTEATDGENAWDLLQEKKPPQLLILDWLMPKLDGIALCQRIKENIPNKPYIILLTQVSGTHNIIKGLEAGADEFLSKPFNMAELRSRLSVGAKIITQHNKMNQFTFKINELIQQISAITIQIAESLAQNNQTQTENNLKALSQLNSDLKKIIEHSRGEN